jgi:molybdenum cofactor biosynthesis enzyme MoaA
MTRRRGHDTVLKCLDTALSSNLHVVKLNVVVISGMNDSEIPMFVEMTKSSDLAVRFIEYMPFQGISVTHSERCDD